MLRSSLVRRAGVTFASLGYEIHAKVIGPALLKTLASSVSSGVHERHDAFLSIPAPSDVLTQEVKSEDPAVQSLRRKFAEQNQIRKMRRKRRRMLLRLKQQQQSKQQQLLQQTNKKLPPPTPSSTISASDLTKMAQQITSAIQSMSPSTASINNDPQRLQAINMHSCNVHATSAKFAELLHGDAFGRSVLGRIAKQHGIGDPVLYCDRPLLQLPFGRGTHFHFAAPYLGVESVLGGSAAAATSSSINALSIWVPLTSGVSIRVLERSHGEVESKIRADPKRLDMRLFRQDFRAVDSDLTLWGRRFPELMASTERAAELTVPLGSAVAFDPFTLAVVAPNVTIEEQALVEFLIISESRAKPSVSPYSWIREWKGSSLSVDFTNSVVFPKLYA
jgi:hypothetical protein